MIKSKQILSICLFCLLLAGCGAATTQQSSIASAEIAAEDGTEMPLGELSAAAPTAALVSANAQIVKGNQGDMRLVGILRNRSALPDKDLVKVELGVIVNPTFSASDRIRQVYVMDASAAKMPISLRGFRFTRLTPYFINTLNYEKSGTFQYVYRGYYQRQGVVKTIPWVRAQLVTY
jgi:hypothetical protein